MGTAPLGIENERTLFLEGSGRHHPTLWRLVFPQNYQLHFERQKNSLFLGLWASPRAWSRVSISQKERKKEERSWTETGRVSGCPAIWIDSNRSAVWMVVVGSDVSQGGKHQCAALFAWWYETVATKRMKEHVSRYDVMWPLQNLNFGVLLKKKSCLWILWIVLENLFYNAMCLQACLFIFSCQLCNLSW